MNTLDPMTLVEQFYETLDRGDQDGLDRLTSPEYICYAPGLPPLNREAGKALWRTMREAFPDLCHPIEDLFVESAPDGGRVVARITLTGTNDGWFQGRPPTGKKLSIQMISIFQVYRGLIVEQWAQLDLLGMMQQVDILPAQA